MASRKALACVRRSTTVSCSRRAFSVCFGADTPYAVAAHTPMVCGPGAAPGASRKTRAGQPAVSLAGEERYRMSSARLFATRSAASRTAERARCA